MSYLQVGPNAIESLAKVIEEASKSELGIVALIVIVLAILALYFFRKAPVRIRVAIFLLMFCGAFLYGAAVMKVQCKEPPKPSIIAGTVQDADSGAGIEGAELTLVGRNERELSDTTGNFRIVLNDLGDESDVQLRVSKSGYKTARYHVTPPQLEVLIGLYR